MDAELIEVAQWSKEIEKLPVKRPANADISLHCNGHSKIDASSNAHLS